MKWPKLREILKRDEWLKLVIGLADNNALARCNTEADKEKWMKIWCDCQLTHIMFCPFEGLNPYWRPVLKILEVATTPEGLSPTVMGPYGCFKEWSDTLGYEWKYALVLKIRKGSTETLHVEWFEDRPLKRRSFRWATVDLWRKYQKKGMKVEGVAVVQNRQIISDGEYLLNCFNVFKFPTGFNPLREWMHVYGDTW